MGKLWIVILFLGTFLIGSSIVKRMVIRFMNSADNQNVVSAITAEKEDPKVFWAEEGRRREPEQAEYKLSPEDFFENESTEFAESFEEEFAKLSAEEADEILNAAGLLEKEDGE